MSSAITIPVYDIRESSTAQFSAILKDETGSPISGSSLTSMTLTVYDNVSNTIINSRDHANVLNANGVTVSETGKLVWTLTANDSPIANSANVDDFGTESHTALFEYRWASGDKASSFELILRVQAVNRLS